MITEKKQWTASKDDMDFLARLNEDINELDFYYEYTSSPTKFDKGDKKKKDVLMKIKNVKDKDIQEVAIALYDLHVSKNNGRLAIKWEWFLED